MESYTVRVDDHEDNSNKDFVNLPIMEAFCSSSSSFRKFILPTLLISLSLVFLCFLIFLNSSGISEVPLMIPSSSSSHPKVSKEQERVFDFKELSRSSNFSVEELVNLDTLLNSAKFRNNTVILTTLNQAWAANGTMIDLFMDGFRGGIGIESFLGHLVIIALDQPSYDRCMEIHGKCFMLKTEDVDFSGEEKHFMTEDYLKMMWRRIYFLNIVLQLGYNFVFSDADIVWFRDPFQHFSPDSDFEIACDHYVGVDTDLSNGPNGGFVHAVASNKTIQLYKLWYESRTRFPGRHDQDVLNDIKMGPEFAELELHVRFLSTELFGGFCERGNDLNKICTMHANCCGTGLENKLGDLRLVAEDWRLFRCMTEDQREKYKIEWRAPRYC